MARGDPRFGETSFEFQLSKLARHAVEPAQRGFGLGTGASDGKCRRVGDSVAVSPPACMRRRQTLRRPLQQIARRSQIASAESGATGNSGAKQLGCAREFVGLSANPIGHLERVRNSAGQKQSGDVRVGDVESHMWGIECPRRDVVAGLRDADGFVGAARISRDLSEHPGDLRTDDGNIGQRKAFRGLHRRLRLVHREPVHRQKGIDVRSRIGGCVARTPHR